jgi:hypothetical protein
VLPDLRVVLPPLVAAQLVRGQVDQDVGRDLTVQDLAPQVWVVGVLEVEPERAVLGLLRV